MTDPDQPTVAIPAVPRRIVVGLDGSDDSARAVATAVGLATACDAEVIAVHAVGLMHRVGDQMRPSDKVRPLIHEQVAEWARPLAATGIAHRIVVEDGPPGLVLLRLAEREDAGLIVCGSRGIGSADGVVLGSTSHHLVQHSPVPVVVIPHQPAG